MDNLLISLAVALEFRHAEPLRMETPAVDKSNVCVCVCVCVCVRACVRACVCVCIRYTSLMLQPERRRRQILLSVQQVLFIAIG
jgi:hypothetical protein